jgi:O-antigen/teichoic acid export membrane protein
VIGLAILPLFFLVIPFVGIFYGPRYLSTIPLFQRLLGVVLFDVFATPLLLLAYHFKRPRLLAGADALRAGTLVGTGALLIPPFGPTGAIAAKFAGKVVGAAVTLVLLALRRPVDPSASAPARKIGPS